MQIKPAEGLLLIKKHKNTSLKVDIVIEDTDNDKKLITGEVISEGSKLYPKQTSVVFGKYSIFELLLQGEKFYFIDEKDILATTNYIEK